ncbi:hypothetical protein PRIC1_004133 [Phytophthora ramorum]
MATSFAFAEVKALVLRPQREQAQQLLERLAAAVLPILMRRRFRVRRLLEFFPTDGALLGMNVNRGAKIYVRLRPKRTPESFYPYEALLETLLHELTHMVHGPHNQAFYQYLDELKQEMESLMVCGLEGEEAVKFADAGAGQRLGGDSARVPIRVAAVLAAKRREQYHSLLGGETSRRLGSTTSSSASTELLDPQALRRKVVEAAERRRRDNEHCRNVLREGASHEVLGIESSDEDEDESSASARTGTTDIIVLDDDENAAELQSPSVSHTADRSTAAIIDLLDGQDEEENGASNNRDTLAIRDRKRKRQEEASEIIDLT